MRTPNNERLTPDIAEAGGADKSAPERRCILSGEHGARHALVRLAISPDGVVLPDPLARAPGRGAWIGVSRAVLEEAIARGRLRGALARAFKGAPLTVPEDLAQKVDDALSRVLLDRLGLEMRGGRLILGSDRIAEHARAGRIALLLHAADASEDGSKKLDQAWRVGRDAEGTGERGIRLPLDRAALSVALGRDNVVHLALADAAAAERVGSILARLLHFRGLAPDEHDGAPGQPGAPGSPVAAGDEHIEIEG
ncbi:DUF448 domain-containing protein [Pelagerythrobacter marensis]|uniref:Transcription terminating nucleic-acid-binding protein n=1 Tax=Pelagerythrobacter marensis TaxID=543877 RepID=A0A0G3XAI9_9SPHN|nr:DUF448 domain-containing protein [Pelagerythrobacter marensis]AKM07636.1 Transcription terminating nucleic-acid-binding protein [Pelagerythrobacter marensis]